MNRHDYQAHADLADTAKGDTQPHDHEAQPVTILDRTLVNPWAVSVDLIGA